MDRRVFICSSVALFSMPVIGAETHSNVKTLITKYQYILNRLSDPRYIVITPYSDGSREWTLNRPTDELYSLLSDLFGYICVEFPPPDVNDIEANRVETRKLFNGQARPDEYRNIPPTLAIEVIPIAVIHDMMSVQKVDFEPEKLGYAWEIFSERYADLLLV